MKSQQKNLSRFFLLICLACLPLSSATFSATSKPIVTVVAVGDVSLAAKPSSNKTQPKSVLKHVAPFLQQADLAFCNLECCLSHRGKPEEKTYVFRAVPSTASILREVGIDLVSLANNHSVDYGRSALLDTMQTLQAYDIRWIGAGRNLSDARQPRFFTFGKGNPAKIRVAFLAFSNMQPTDFYAGARRSGTMPAWESYIRDDVAAASKQADFTIVSFHCGKELSDVPRKRERRLAHCAIDAGADLVLGSHPHVLQGIEQYKSGIIAYSLGNFVFGSRGKSKETVILRAHLQLPDTVSVELIPVVIKGSTPHVAKGKQASTVLKRLVTLSAKLDTKLQVKNMVAVCESKRLPAKTLVSFVGKRRSIDRQ